MIKENTKKLNVAEDERRALIQMYQAGFLDGYNSRTIFKHGFTAGVKKRCIKAFEARFVPDIQKEVKGGNLKNGRTNTNTKPTSGDED